jgi:phosphoglycolate phosphatase-like HAD superfamily hydrolase
VDSNSIKWRAFEACFAEFPDRLVEIMAYCRGQHHTVRGEKFRHVSEKILGLPYTPEVAAELHARFEGASTRQIIEAAEVAGAARFLEAVRGTHLTGLLSSTPHRVFLRILSGRGWRDYFAVVRGAPVGKAHWLEAFRRTRGLHVREAVFFGDTPEDADAAHAAGWTFVVVANEKLMASEAHCIPDFTSLLVP